MTNGRDPATRPDPDEITRLAIERRISRRHFLIGSGAGFSATVLAACAPTPAGSSAGSSAAPTTAASAAGSAAASPATGGSLGDTLNLATWPNYHDPGVLDGFTAKTGVAINMGVYGSTEEMEAKIRAGNSGIDVVVPHRGGMTGLWFSKTAPRNLTDAKATRTDLFRPFHAAMIAAGVYLPPSAYEAWFVSTAHGPRELGHVIDATARFAATAR